MLYRVSCYFSSIITDSRDEAEVITYGCEILLYTIISTLGLLLLGYITYGVIPPAIVIIVFYLNQSFGGGYHATSHLKCFIIMSIGLFVALFLSSICWIPFSSVGLLSCLYLFFNPLILHPNKKYLETKRKELLIKSRFVICVETILFVCMSFCKIPPEHFAFGLFVSSLSRFAAKMRSI